MKFFLKQVHFVKSAVLPEKGVVLQKAILLQDSIAFVALSTATICNANGYGVPPLLTSMLELLNKCMGWARSKGTTEGIFLQNHLSPILVFWMHQASPQGVPRDTQQQTKPPNPPTHPLRICLYCNSPGGETDQRCQMHHQSFLVIKFRIHEKRKSVSIVSGFP